MDLPCIFTLLLVLFSHCLHIHTKHRVSDEHTTERRLGRDDATEDDDDVPTMRTSMTVGGAGATTERELGELKVRLRPRRRSMMGSVDDDARPCVKR